MFLIFGIQSTQLCCSVWPGEQYLGLEISDVKNDRGPNVRIIHFFGGCAGDFVGTIQSHLTNLFSVFGRWGGEPHPSIPL